MNGFLTNRFTKLKHPLKAVYLITYERRGEYFYSPYTRKNDVTRIVNMYLLFPEKYSHLKNFKVIEFKLDGVLNKYSADEFSKL